MRVRFPFLYRVQAVMPRHRVAQGAVLLGWETAEIPEIDADRAPVAIRARAAPVVLNTATGAHRVGAEREEIYRQRDGGLIAPGRLVATRGLSRVAGQQEVEDSGPIAAADLEARMRAWAEALLARVEAGSLVGGFKPLFPGDVQRIGQARDERTFRCREIQSSERAATAGRMVDLFARSAFVDGVFHRPSEGPAWLVLSSRRPVPGEGGVPRDRLVLKPVLVPELAEFSGDARARMLPPEQGARVVEQARERAAASGGEVSVVGAVEMVRAPAPTRAGRAIAAAGDLVERMRPDVGFFGNDGIRDFVRLREHTARLNPASGDKAARALADQAARLLEVWEAHRAEAGLPPPPDLRAALESLARPDPVPPPVAGAPPAARGADNRPTARRDRDAVTITDQDMEDLGLVPRR